ncbi:MAG: molybdopterin-dependent oxidoreductase [Phycisphaeraceae bacterium]|nr:molybdopterin-dependent oxidoreductase [Phycisphaeraceae bacterium]
MPHTLTTCTFCGAGCGLYLETQGHAVVGAYPSISHPTNSGRLCVRGWNVHEVANSRDRLTQPLLRRNGGFEQVSWPEAFDYVARRLLEIRGRYGPDAVAFLNSPRCSNEESYLLQRLARAVVGTNNVDHGAGVYSNNSINVLLDMLGVAASTSSLADLSLSDVIVVDGVDLYRQLPTIAGRVIRAKLNGAKLVVIDVRRHRVAENADLFLQIRPGTETLLYGTMAKVIVDRGLANLPFIKARCRDYESFLAQVHGYDILRAADRCGVPVDLIEAAALTYARASSAALLYSTGVESRSTPSIQAIVNLVLLTGQLAKRGAGLFPLTEHNNLQGVCDMGVLPDRLPGYALVADAGARAALGALWKASVPASPGLSAQQVLSDRGRGRVKAVWLCRYDPVGTALIGDAGQALDECELVVVQHLFMTASARHAHVILPTTAFGEERVTFTNTERRVQLAEKVIDPSPGLGAAWEQLTAVARAMGAEWRYESSAQIMREIGQAVPFYSGADYDNLARDFGRQWPCTHDRPLGTPQLFGETGERRERFRFLPLAAPAAIVTAGGDYPLMLVFGHSLYYWHHNVLIQHSETLKREYRVLLLDYPDGFVEMNTTDAQQWGIRDGQRIRIRSAAGSASSTARVTPEIRPGTILVPYFVNQLRQQLAGPALSGQDLIPVCVEKDAA